ncbi:MAG: hypothetical protein N4A35_06955 [Flavobacteriales bacterium]|jgi:hypothetical protein|nr:hypothetical protein [Flavobacteriales bacterium]
MKKIAFIILVILGGVQGYSQLQYTYEVTHVLNNLDASIQVYVTNGSGASHYHYTWYNTSMSVIGTNSSSISGLNQGVYYLKVADTLDTDTTNYIYTYFWVGKYGETTTLEIQPNEMFAHDASLRRIDRSGYTHVINTNYGNNANFIAHYGTWSGLPDIGKGIMKFDYNGLVEASSTTVNLTLYGWYYRYIASSNPLVHNEVLVKRIKNGVSWKEHTVTYSSFYADNPSVNVESTPAAVISAQGSPNSTVTAQFIKTVNISTIVADQISGVHENNGLFFELKYNGKYRSQYFYGANHSEAVKRPKLTIAFAIPNLVTTYTPVSKTYDGSYVKVMADRKLRFSYTEEYEDQDIQMEYTIYDQKHVPVSFSQSLISSYGSNRRVIDVSSLSSQGGVYTLEIKNEKGEKWGLKFKLQ